MSADAPFFDTNVVLYLFGDDDRKRSIADALLEAGGGASVQLLNEVAHVARRKMLWEWPKIETTLAKLETVLDIAPLTLAAHRLARRIAGETNCGVYDALMLAVALENGAKTFFSEVLQHGRVVDGMAIRDPFRER